MLKAISKRLKNNKGFTLVELIVVIGILGILTTIAIPKLTGVFDDAKNAVDQQNLKLLQQAAELYAAENEGVYPDDSNDFLEYFDELPKQSNNDSFYFNTENKKVVTEDPGKDGFPIE